MPISIRYRLRPPKKAGQYSNPHAIQCRITVDGVEDPGIGVVWQNEKLVINPAKWDQNRQRSSVRDDIVNEYLIAHKSAIMEIFRNQKARGWKPTKQSVKYEFLEGLPPILLSDGGFHFPAWDKAPRPISVTLSGESMLTDAFAAYIVTLQVAGKLSTIEGGRYKLAHERIKEFLLLNHEPTLPCYKLTLGWAKRFHSWLQTIDTGRHGNQRMCAGHATRYLARLSKCLTWMVDEGWLYSNPILNKKWPAHSTKEVYFLEDDHIDIVLAMKGRGTPGDVLWWFKLMMLTGLDYPDVRQYAKNPKAYEQTTPDGVLIVGKRKKPPHVEYAIPRLPQLDALFAEHPNGPSSVVSNTINKYTFLIEDKLNFKDRITIKTARKTAGVLFLYAGYEIAEVSRILGHASVQTTERYYVKVTKKMVQRAMKRLKS